MLQQRRAPVCCQADGPHPRLLRGGARVPWAQLGHKVASGCLAASLFLQAGAPRQPASQPACARCAQQPLRAVGCTQACRPASRRQNCSTWQGRPTSCPRTSCRPGGTGTSPAGSSSAASSPRRPQQRSCCSSTASCTQRTAGAACAGAPRRHLTLHGLPARSKLESPRVQHPGLLQVRGGAGGPGGGAWLRAVHPQSAAAGESVAGTSCWWPCSTRLLHTCNARPSMQLSICWS